MLVDGVRNLDLAAVTQKSPASAQSPSVTAPGRFRRVTAVGIELQVFRWLNIIRGNTSNTLYGADHKLRPQPLACYLGEFCYRFNRRFDRHFLIGCLLQPCPRTSLARSAGCASVSCLP
jgi:hypothetical protein